MPLALPTDQTQTSGGLLRMSLADDDAMAPTIGRGDVLMIDTSVGAIAFDDIYQVQLDSTICVRRMQRLGDGTLRMICDNERYEAFALNREAQARLRVLGRVVRIWNERRL